MPRQEVQPAPFEQARCGVEIGHGKTKTPDGVAEFLDLGTRRIGLGTRADRADDVERHAGKLEPGMAAARHEAAPVRRASEDHLVVFDGRVEVANHDRDMVDAGDHGRTLDPIRTP